jgi:hypothetical protein
MQIVIVSVAKYISKTFVIHEKKILLEKGPKMRRDNTTTTKPLIPNKFGVG